MIQKRKFRKPDRQAIERAFEAEASKAGVPVVDLIVRLHAKTDPKVIRARRRAIRRVLAETGCSRNGLARVLGVCSDTVDRAAREFPTVYDDLTKARLTWRHGFYRARQIMAEQDARTEADLAAWNRLGRRDAA